ncbi:hypothetical protein ACK3SF_04665 [Candidatus Nanosalina sp. VS9-1]|uniref:hypothetical protein n=1 Tax=Candidatus Nanosalina sp. VS9-1 TaxID=3388566 RepID=UPI0039DF7388
MISIKGQKALKVAITLIFTTLVIGNAAALDWDSPSNADTVIGSDYTLNVTHESGTGSEVIFYWSDQGQDDWTQFDTDSSPESYSGGDRNYWTAQLSDEGSGQYTIRANLTDGTSEIELAEIDLTKDQGPPSVSLQDGDLDFVSDNPSITVLAEDEYSNIDDLSAYADNTDILDEKDVDCSSGSRCLKEFDLDTDNLNIGYEISLNLEAVDQVGNSGESNPTLTFDNEFQADDPEFTVEDADGDNVDLNGDVGLDVTVGNIDEEESDVQVKCLVDGDEVSTTDWDDEEDFSCEIPSEEVDDDTVDVSVEACDRAGNCAESDERFYTFDSSDPVLENFEAARDYKVYSDDFDVTYEASDSASGVQELEYFFYAGTSEGDGNTVEYDGEGRFTVDTALLDSEDTQQTVYVRARDRVGHWSDVRSIDFEYHPDATPRIALEASDNFSVEAGSTGNIDVVVENTGKLLVESVEVTASSQLFEGTKTVEGLEEGDSANAEFEISPSENQTGLWNATFESDSPSASDSVEILVKANSAQREKVDSRIETYSSRLAEIESNISSLRSSGINGELDSSLESGTSEFVEMVERAEQFQESGEYHRALSVVEGLESSYQSASSTVEEVKKQHESNEFRQTLMMMLLGLVIIGGAGGAFLYTSDRRDLDLQIPRGLELPQIPAVSAFSEKIEAAVDRFRDKMAEEEEKAEEAFEGFH